MARELNIRISVDGAGQAKASIGGVDRQISTFQKSVGTAGMGLGKFTAALTVATAAGHILARGIERAVVGAVRLARETFIDAVSSSVALQNAMIGLTTIAGKFGFAASDAQTAARNLAQDGLLTVTEAASGLKNLLASGFGLPEAIELMLGFKDSAAFNRQASLGFGQAVVSATEGIKNQNSILIDNAGVTKNYSVIAKEMGLTIQDLARVSTDANVREKIRIGLLKETALFSGDAAKLTQVYTGAMSRNAALYDILLAKIGDAVVKNTNVAQVLTFVGDMIEKVTARLGENSRGYDVISALVIGFVSVLNLALGGLSAMILALVKWDLRTTSARIAVISLRTDVLRLTVAFLELSDKLNILGDPFADLIRSTKAQIAVYREDINVMAENAKARAVAAGVTVAAIDSVRTELGILIPQLEAERGASIEVAGAQVAQAETSETLATASGTLAAALGGGGGAAGGGGGTGLVGALQGIETQAYSSRAALEELVRTQNNLTIVLPTVTGGTLEATQSFLGMSTTLPTVIGNLTAVRETAEAASVSFGQTLVNALGVAKKSAIDFGKQFFSVSNLMSTAMNAAFGPSGLVTGLMQKGMEKMADLAWKGLKKIGGWFKDLFGGPSAEELGGREVAREFDRTVNEMFDLVRDRVGPAHEQWERNNILVREAYIAMGFSATDAVRMAGEKLQELWRAEKEGPAAAKAVADSIRELLKSLTGDAQTVGKELKDLFDDLGKTKITIPVNYERTPNDGIGGGLPGFAHGGYVSQTGPALLHAGEQVLTRQQVLAGRGGGGSSVVVNVDASGSFFDSPASIKKLGRMVSQAITHDTQLQKRLQVA